MTAPLHVEFTRAQWARLRADTPLTLTEEDLRRLRGLNERVSLEEVVEIYLPLSRLLNLHAAATKTLHAARAVFLDDQTAKVPYVIGMAGSVAVGKSTTARILRELLSRWPEHPRVDLVTTDGFLYPRQTLEGRGLLSRKGFPETYDRRSLLSFLMGVKAGEPQMRSPVYSHLTYDIVPDAVTVVDRPDLLILEGLNVLQAMPSPRGPSRAFVSDFFDFTIYVDAGEELVRHWYIERFLALRTTAFKDPASYFHRYASLEDAEAREVAAGIWDRTNGPNLRQNILPTRERADLILEKGADHATQRVRLRKL
jgi:type I pantothenate kinase